MNKISNTLPSFTEEVIHFKIKHNLRIISDSSRSAYKRGKEHFASLARKEESSVLWKHSIMGVYYSFVCHLQGKSKMMKCYGKFQRQ